MIKIAVLGYPVTALGPEWSTCPTEWTGMPWLATWDGTPFKAMRYGLRSEAWKLGASVARVGSAPDPTWRNVTDALGHELGSFFIRGEVPSWLADYVGFAPISEYRTLEDGTIVTAPCRHNHTPLHLFRRLTQPHALSVGELLHLGWSPRRSRLVLRGGELYSEIKCPRPLCELET